MPRRLLLASLVLLASVIEGGCCPCVKACTPVDAHPTTSRPSRAAPAVAAIALPTPDADSRALPPEVLVPTRRTWSVVVLHHSASTAGGAQLFDGWHKARGWDGVGYDFVIGNGTDTADGALETTFRWKEQRDGAHVKGWNDLAIGICLVGNFEETDPTPAQRETLVHLVRHLRRRFSIPRERVVGHGALGETLCPGKRLDVKAIAKATDPDAEKSDPEKPDAEKAAKPDPEKTP